MLSHSPVQLCQIMVKGALFNWSMYQNVAVLDRVCLRAWMPYPGAGLCGQLSWTVLVNVSLVLTMHDLHEWPPSKWPCHLLSSRCHHSCCTCGLWQSWDSLCCMPGSFRFRSWQGWPFDLAAICPCGSLDWLSERIDVGFCLLGFLTIHLGSHSSHFALVFLRNCISFPPAPRLMGLHYGNIPITFPCDSYQPTSINDSDTSWHTIIIMGQRVERQRAIMHVWFVDCWTGHLHSCSLNHFP